MDQGLDEPSLGGWAQPAMKPKLPAWPLSVGIGLAVAGIATMLRWDALWSAIAYAAVLCVGTVLVFYQRVTAVLSTRSAEMSVVPRITVQERLTIGLLIVGCLANGIVLAFWAASR